MSLVLTVRRQFADYSGESQLAVELVECDRRALSRRIRRRVAGSGELRFDGLSEPPELVDAGAYLAGECALEAVESRDQLVFVPSRFYAFVGTQAGACWSRRALGRRLWRNLRRVQAGW